jgi:DNA (cytosine-5)-methyltransferase 1
MQRLKLGSLFSGIGGFELGLEDSIPGLETVWQVEQNKFCQRILSKHWPEAKIYDDVREINKNNVESVDVLCGGFPCQDISIAGKQRGVNEGEKSSLWWEMWRIISELRPQVIVLENVSAIVTNGGTDVISSLTQLGYDCGWCVIRSGADFGAPHIRSRWFCVAYPNSNRNGTQNTFCSGGSFTEMCIDRDEFAASTYPHSKRIEKQSFNTFTMETGKFSECRSSETSRIYTRNYWEKFPTQSPVCRGNDGVPNRVDRIRALGNAIVPQASAWVGKKIWESGLLL